MDQTMTVVVRKDTFRKMAAALQKGWPTCVDEGMAATRTLYAQMCEDNPQCRTIGDSARHSEQEEQERRAARWARYAPDRL